MNHEDRPDNPAKKSESKKSARAAISVAMSENREQEEILIQRLNAEGIKAAAADFGGPFPSCFSRMLEACLVAAKREGVIGGNHAEEGAVVGACHEAVNQVFAKALGLNVGGKIGIARYQDHLCVCVFFSIGLLHLNDVAIGMAHRFI